MKYKNYQNEFENRIETKKKRKDYRQNPNRLKKDIERTKNRAEINRKFILDYKEDKSCQICGWNEHTEVLQFHHKDSEEKKYGISKVIRFSLEKTKEEIKKCILLCPNCHMWIHYTKLKEDN